MFEHIKFFIAEIATLFSSTLFVFLTIVGNGLIFLVSYLFFLLEHGSNPKVERYMDALWWSFATATTTGYGDITPVTDAGKILSICLMLAGLAMFSMYTALFAETMLTSRKKFKNQL